MRRAVPLLAVAAFIMMPSVAPAASHDDPSSARPITGLPYLDTADTSDATTQQGEYTSACAPSGATVWYRIDALTEPIVISTSGSDYDTVVTVFANAPFTDSWLACNDDAQGTRQSQVLLAAQPAARFPLYVQVGGWTGDTGSLRLSVTRAGSISGTITDQDGAPRWDGCVTLYDSPSTWRSWTFTTSAGTYRFPLVPSGTYRVAVRDDCEWGSPFFYGGGSGSDITVTDQDVTGIDIVFPRPAPPPSGQIAGSFTVDGAPATGCVSAYDTAGLQRARGWSWLGSGYVLGGLPSGDYLLFADDGCGEPTLAETESRDDIAPLKAEWFDDATSSATGVPVTVVVGSTSIADVDLAPLQGLDLAVTAVRQVEQPASPGERISFEVDVENSGTVRSTAAEIALRICPETVGPCSREQTVVSSLSPGERTTVVVWWWQPSVTVGRLSLHAIATLPYDQNDANNEVVGAGHVLLDVPVGIRLCPGGCP